MPCVLYLGLTLPTQWRHQAIHCPIIQTIPRAFTQPDIQQAFLHFLDYTHLVFTSQTTIPLFLKAAAFYQIELHTIQTKKIVAVGQKTAAKLCQQGLKVDFVPQEETAEGIQALFAAWDPETLYPLWPHSALARPVLVSFWAQKEIKYQECILYETVANREIALPDLSAVEEIIFTSPSTVDAFLERYSHFPKGKKLTPIGPITARRLKEKGGDYFSEIRQF